MQNEGRLLRRDPGGVRRDVRRLRDDRGRDQTVRGETGGVLQEAAQGLLRGGYPQGAIWQDSEEGSESKASVWIFQWIIVLMLPEDQFFLYENDDPGFI